MANNQIQKLAQQLEELGLTEKEASVYVASLFLGASPVQKIAKQADVNRPTAYVILEQLAEKGLVSESTEQKKAVFIAEPPEAIGLWLEKQEREIKNKKEGLKELIPKLENTHREDIPEAPQVRFYRGLDGILNINAESFRKAKPKSVIYGITNVDEVEKLLPKHFDKGFEHRIKKNIASKIFYWSKYTEIESRPNIRETHKVSEPPKADISLFEDRAIIFTYAGRNSTGIVIESKEIVEALRQIFELAWENQNSKNENSK